MIKVLYVLDWLMLRSGTTSVAMNYFLNVDRTCTQIDFLLLSDRSEDAVIAEVQRNGANIYCLPVIQSRNIFDIQRTIGQFFKNHSGEYAIVHSHLFQLDWLLFYYAKKNGTQICISHSHATNWADDKLRAIRNRIMAFPVPYCADVWGACSVAAGELLYGKRFAKSPKRWIIHNAIEVKKFAFDSESRERTRREFGYTDEIVLGHVGRLTSVKNQGFLFDIMRSLLDREERKYRLLIVGDGELRDALEAKAQQTGAYEYVTFTGMRADIPELLWAMDVFLLPSHHEGFPVSGIEAQAAGLPCVFSDAITREAAITKAAFLSIKNGANTWADTIIGLQIGRVYDAVDRVKEAGYDIETEGKRVAKRYIDLVDTAKGRD